MQTPHVDTRLPAQLRRPSPILGQGQNGIAQGISVARTHDEPIAPVSYHLPIATNISHHDGTSHAIASSVTSGNASLVDGRT